MSGLPSPKICQRILALWVVLGEPDWSETDRVRLINLLTQHEQSFNDLPAIFHAAGMIAAPLRQKDKLYERLWRFFGHLNFDNEPTRLETRKKLDALLNKHNLEWNGPNGFTAILVAYWARNNNISTGAVTSQTRTDNELEFNALDFVLTLLEDYQVMSREYRLITGLWALHTYVYERFEYTPRLLVVSPTSGYGKTRFLEILNQFVTHPHTTKNTSVAAIYHRLARDPRTCYLLDEGENQGIFNDSVLRAVIDAGYEGGTVDRVDAEFPVHFPCAIALRGQIHDVPLAILSRSHVLPRVKGTPRKRFDRRNPGPDFPVARELIAKWEATVALNLDPEMPEALLRDSRVADNCRPLVAIADSFGDEYSKTARTALVELSADRVHQEPAIRALTACKAVFDAMDVDRIERKALAKAVIEQDDYFSDWRGANDQGTPHELSPGELSRLLKQLGIRARSMRISKDKWGWGYIRAQIESAWRTHSPESHDTASHPSKIIALSKL